MDKEEFKELIKSYLKENLTVEIDEYRNWHQPHTAGTLQFTAYNEHNGYYSHDAFVISNQIKYEISL